MTRWISTSYLAGRPVSDKYLVLVDEAGQPVVEGETGELIVKSPYIAEGYWRRPEETAAFFKQDANAPGQRIYEPVTSEDSWPMEVWCFWGGETTR